MMVLGRKRISRIGRHLSSATFAAINARKWRCRSRVRRQIEDVIVVLLEELLVLKVRHIGLLVVRVDGHGGLTNGAQGVYFPFGIELFAAPP